MKHDIQQGHITHLPTMPAASIDLNKFVLRPVEIPKGERDVMEYITCQEVRITQLRNEDQSEEVDAQLAQLHRVVDHAYRMLGRMRKYQLSQPLVLDPIQEKV